MRVKALDAKRVFASKGGGLRLLVRHGGSKTGLSDKLTFLPRFCLALSAVVGALEGELSVGVGVAEVGASTIGLGGEGLN
jgi:hypothetical protein